MQNANDTINSLVPPGVCKLFGEQSMTVDLLLFKLNELSNSIESDEIKIQQLKDDISYEIISNDVILSSIQNKKYQLGLSQNLLNQITNDIKKLESQKHSIINGNFEGQITLKMAQREGYVYLKKDDQHAIEFLASELRFPLLSFSKVSKPPNSDSESESESIQNSDFLNVDDYLDQPTPNNFRYTANMKHEIANLFNESIKFFKGLKKLYKEQTKLRATVTDKLNLIQKEVKRKQEEKINSQIELNQLEGQIFRLSHERKIIKVRPDRFSETEKGQRIIESTQKEIYRFNRILNEFNNRQKKNHQKDLFNSFEIEMKCFNESFQLDEQLEKLTRKIRRNVLDLSHELVSHKNYCRNKLEQKEQFLSSNISSIENILNEIESSNHNLAEKVDMPNQESASDFKEKLII